MLSATSMEAVSHWRDKQDIVRIDQDSSSVPDGSLLDGLAGKFAREGYSGHMWFVKGGHGAVRSSGANLVQSDEQEPALPALKGPSGGGLMAGGMARRAFQQGISTSTTQYGHLLIFRLDWRWTKLSRSDHATRWIVCLWKRYSRYKPTDGSLFDCLERCQWQYTSWLTYSFQNIWIIIPRSQRYGRQRQRSHTSACQPLL
jgi:hypothetical protein